MNWKEMLHYDLDRLFRGNETRHAKKTGLRYALPRTGRDRKALLKAIRLLSLIVKSNASLSQGLDAAAREEQRCDSQL